MGIKNELQQPLVKLTIRKIIFKAILFLAICNMCKSPGIFVWWYLSTSNIRSAVVGIVLFIHVKATFTGLTGQIRQSCYLDILHRVQTFTIFNFQGLLLGWLKYFQSSTVFFDWGYYVVLYLERQVISVYFFLNVFITIYC